MGVVLSRFDVDRVYRRMVTFADAHKHVNDAQLRAIIEEVQASDAAGARAPAPTAATPAPAREFQGAIPKAGYGRGV
jgi:hypothetical protein